MKQIQFLGISLLLSAMMLAGFASNAFALTAACDPIDNQATLAYTVGGNNYNLLSDDPNQGGASDSTIFYVDSKVDLSMALFSGNPVTATGKNQLMIFRITNEGNDSQRYQLQVYAGSGETINISGTDYLDDFDMLNVRVVVDPTPDGTLESTLDLVTGAATAGGDEVVIDNAVVADGTDLATLTPSVAGDVAGNNVLEVYVIADVPPAQGTGSDAHYSLRARTYQVAGVNGADGNPGTETGTTGGGDLTAPSGGCAGGQVVRADGDADFDGEIRVGATPDDAPNDGDYFATGTYTVSAANISVSKTVTTIYDPINGAAPAARPIPLAYVQYSITVSNAVGSAAATLNTINDTLHASLLHDPDLITTAGPGNPEDPANPGGGFGFKITHTAAGRTTNATQYFSTGAADAVDIAGASITADLAVALPSEGVAPAYQAGELRGGESVTLTFNAIIQ